MIYLLRSAVQVGVSAEDIPPPGEAAPLTETNKTSDRRGLQAEIGHRVDLKNTIAGSKQLERQLQTTEQVKNESPLTAPSLPNRVQT